LGSALAALGQAERAQRDPDWPRRAEATGEVKLLGG
jgi:hypothetical protein